MNLPLRSAVSGESCSLYSTEQPRQYPVPQDYRSVGSSLEPKGTWLLKPVSGASSDQRHHPSPGSRYFQCYRHLSGWEILVYEVADSLLIRSLEGFPRSWNFLDQIKGLEWLVQR